MKRKTNSGFHIPADMDKECISLCALLNQYPGLETFESCCGHLKDRYSIWFKCNNIDLLSRLGRATNKNYSSGKFEIVLDSTDTSPRGIFWLRSTEPFKSYDEMMEEVSCLCDDIIHWTKDEFDEYFSKNRY